MRKTTLLVVALLSFAFFACVSSGNATPGGYWSRVPPPEKPQTMTAPDGATLYHYPTPPAELGEGGVGDVLEIVGAAAASLLGLGGVWSLGKRVLPGFTLQATTRPATITANGSHPPTVAP
jgi:hypothetical protein